MPNAGILPSARSQETAAPVGRSVSDVATTLAGMSDVSATLSKSALDGKRIGVIAPTGGNSQQRFTEALEVIDDLGATPVTLTAPNRPTTPKVVDREFKRDLDAYLAPYGKSTAGIVSFNDAHPADTLKFGQARLRAAAAIDLSDPATRAGYETDLATGRTASRAWLDGLLTDVDAIVSLTASTVEVGIRAGYPQVVLPMGYDPTIRRPVALSFTGRAGDDAKLLGFAYAYERAAQIRRTPSEVNPQTWHCVAPIIYIPRTCGPGELAPDIDDSVSVPLPVGGTVPATLALTLGGPVSFGAFTPGVAREYTASTTANVISTALDATLTVSDPGHLMNGTFALPSRSR